MNTHLLIMDPQNDFCDPQRGSLYVKGAENDMARLARFIDANGEWLDQIHVTLDSHQTIHIAHPIFWKNAQGQNPAPFTIITSTDVASGKWTTTNPAWSSRGTAYVQALERNGRYQLMIWPPHCRIGSWGHTIFPSVSDALLRSEEVFFRKVDFIFKGSNIFTEHYSAVVADVPDENDPGTQLNLALIDQLKTADRIFLAGEALSHCLANTTMDLARHLGGRLLQKVVLLSDTSSNVTGCEGLGQHFVSAMSSRGMRRMMTEEASRELKPEGRT